MSGGGRIALVTGASSGIGLATARALLDDGWRVVCCARRREAMEEAFAGDNSALVVPLDVTDDDRVFEVFRSFREELGRLDRVVVNAGLGKGAPLGTGNFAANRETELKDTFIGCAQLARVLGLHTPASTSRTHAAPTAPLYRTARSYCDTMITMVTLLVGCDVGFLGNDFDPDQPAEDHREDGHRHQRLEHGPQGPDRRLLVADLQLPPHQEAE